MRRDVDQLPPSERFRALADARTWASQSDGRETVVLIEPDAVDADRLGAALVQRGVRFLGFTNPWRALAHVGGEPAAVVVVSVRLGGGLLTEIVTAVKQETSLPVLIAHGSGDAQEIGPAVVAGGLPIVGIPYDPHELIRAVGEALPSLPAPACVEFGRLSLVPEWHDAHFDGVGLDLSRLEFNILAELVRRGGRATSRDALVAASWTTAPNDPKYVLTAAVKRLRQKLEALGVQEAVETVRGVGYRLNAKALGAETLSSGPQGGVTPISATSRSTRTSMSSMILRTS